MFLDQEAQDAVFARLQGQEEEVHQSPEPELSAPATDEIDVKPEESEDTSQFESESSSNNDEDDEGHSIPYNRFKSVIEARNKFKTKSSDLERQLTELQAQMEQETPSRKLEEEDDWFDNIFEDDVAEPESDRYTSLERRLQSFEEERAQFQLEAELQVANVQYPQVPEQVLLQAVMKDPSVDMLSVAEQWNTWMSSVKEDAIANYLNEQKTAAPATPRRPSPTSGTRQASQKKSHSLADARKLALEAWKNTL